MFKLNLRLKFSVLFLFLGFTGLRAMEFNHTEMIQVFDQDLFVREIERVGFMEETGEVSFVFSEFEKIESFTIEYKTSDSKKWKVLKENEISTSDLPTNSFFDDYRIKNAILLKGTSYRIKAKVKCFDLMLLSSFKLNSPEVLFYKYEIQIPKNYEIEFFKPLNLDSTEFEIEKENTDKNLIYRIGNLFKSEEKQDYKRLSCIVHPNDRDSETTFQQWINKINLFSEEFSKNNKAAIDSITDGLINQIDIAKALFNFTQSQIRYVAIEQAYGKWAYRSANAVFENRRGDCKDMANFLVTALKYKGLDAHNALIHTVSANNRDFIPSISGANHAIAICYINGKRYILDATDDSSVFGLPSRHTQGQEFWQIDDRVKGRVEIVCSERNKIYHQMLLRIRDGEFYGNFSIDFFGLQAIRFKELLDENKSREQQFLLEFVSGLTSLKTSNIKTEINIDTSISIQCEVSGGATSIKSVGNKLYIVPNSLIGMKTDLYREEDLPLIRYSTYSDVFHFQISTETEILKVKSEEKMPLSNEFFKYSKEIIETDSKSLGVEYRLSKIVLIVDRDNYEPSNQILEKFNEAVSGYLILELSSN